MGRYCGGGRPDYESSSNRATQTEEKRKGNVMRKEMSLRSLPPRIDGLERRNRAARALEQVLSP